MMDDKPFDEYQPIIETFLFVYDSKGEQVDKLTCNIVAQGNNEAYDSTCNIFTKVYDNNGTQIDELQGQVQLQARDYVDKLPVKYEQVEVVTRLFSHIELQLPGYAGNVKCKLAEVTTRLLARVTLSPKSDK